MSKRQPTFAERIRLLQIASVEATAIAGLVHHEQACTRLREVAAIIDAEVARMQTAQARWQSRQAPKA